MREKDRELRRRRKRREEARKERTREEKNKQGRAKAKTATKKTTRKKKATDKKAGPEEPTEEPEDAGTMAASRRTQIEQQAAEIEAEANREDPPSEKKVTPEDRMQAGTMKQALEELGLDTEKDTEEN